MLLRLRCEIKYRTRQGKRKAKKKQLAEGKRKSKTKLFAIKSSFLGHSFYALTITMRDKVQNKTREKEGTEDRNG